MVVNKTLFLQGSCRPEILHWAFPDDKNNISRAWRTKMTYKKHTQPWEWLREGRTRNQRETALAVCCTLCLGHKETTASQSLYPTSPTILASFKQTITDMSPLLAKVRNPNIGSGSYSIHELIRTASLWLPTDFCLQVYICNTLSSLVWSLSSRCPQAPWNHCYLSNNKAPLSPLTGCCIPHTSIFIHPQTSLLK